MCGIFGYSGNNNAAPIIIEGLKRLEYRGYDSWGIAVVNDNIISIDKHTGPIGDTSNTSTLPDSQSGIGHTRWATHGGVTDINAHPHAATNNSFVVAQNGIVENFQELKKSLEQDGYTFTSQTDTEVIVRLIEQALAQSTIGNAVNHLQAAVRAAFLQLKGRNTIIVLSHESDHMIAIKNGSPLVIGIKDEEIFIASDTLSFAHHTNQVIFVNNNQLIEYQDGKLTGLDCLTNQTIQLNIETIDQQSVRMDKEGHDHYMMKEILEQKYSISEAVSYTEEELSGLVIAVKDATTVYTLGAGGAFYAADQVAYFLRTIAGINAWGLRPYEIESYRNTIRSGDVMLIVSQSGETADNLEALEFLEKNLINPRIASVVNMMGSTTTKLSEFSFLSRSGPELCVLSTKSGSAQTAFGYLLAHSIKGSHNHAHSHIHQLSHYLENDCLNQSLFDQCRQVAQTIAVKEHLFILGKGANYQVSNIAALNIKEASYVHAESFSAGELKHGVIALIEPGTPVIVFVDEDEHRDYMLGATAEVKARGAFVIGISTKENELFDDFIPLPTIENNPSTVIANVIPCQLIAYYTALAKGLNPDKPRNLAKAVTVK